MTCYEVIGKVGKEVSVRNDLFKINLKHHI